MQLTILEKLIKAKAVLHQQAWQTQNGHYPYGKEVDSNSQTDSNKGKPHIDKMDCQNPQYSSHDQIDKPLHFISLPSSPILCSLPAKHTYSDSISYFWYISFFAWLYF